MSSPQWVRRAARQAPRGRRVITVHPGPAGAEQRSALQDALGQTVQTRLKIGAPGDAHEREAESVADQVMRMPDTPVQRRCAQCESEDADKTRNAATLPGPDEQLQRKPQPGPVGPAPVATGVAGTAPARSQPAAGASADLAGRLGAARPRGVPLPAAERAFFEPRLGVSLAPVRVHADRESAELAAQLGARAFAVGRDVYFGAGEYRPGSGEGRHLLAHELTHVLQQARGEPEALQRALIFSSTIDIRRRALTSRSFTVSGSTINVTANAGYANPATCDSGGYDMELVKVGALFGGAGSQHFPSGVSATRTWSGLDAGASYRLIITPTSPPDRPNVCALQGSITVEE